jgi:DNA-binding NarL/FixJ family response regulator
VTCLIRAISALFGRLTTRILAGVKTLIVEDQALFRDMLVRVCQLVLGFHEVTAVGTAAEADRALAGEQYELVILDIDLPDRDGFSIAQDLHVRHPRTRTLGLSAFCDEYMIHRVLTSELHGFVDKSEQTIDSLSAAIESVCSGKYYFTSVVGRVQAELRSNPRAFPKVLTEKEIEVLGMIGEGRDNGDIGNRLHITPNTAQWHRKQIMRKLNIHSVTELMHFAAEKGFTRQGRAVAR